MSRLNDLGAAVRRALSAETLDRAIAHFAPAVAVRRSHARAVLCLSDRYAGGSLSRRSMAGWHTQPGTSADADSLHDLPYLRARSHDLLRNSPLASGAIAGVVTKVVGTGLSLQSRVDRAFLGLSDASADAWQRNTERQFSLWAESTDCDVTRHQTFYELQDLAFRSVLAAGDVFSLAVSIDRPERPYRLALQLVEADRVSNPNGHADTDTLVAGVELDEWGAATAYHVADRYPMGVTLRAQRWQRIAAYGGRTGRRNVLHLFQHRRPGQTRGIPYLAPVIEPLKQVERYTDAELMAAVVSGMFAVFLRSESDVAVGAGKPMTADGRDWDGTLESGLVVDLPPGYTAESINPGRPNANFDPFVMAVLSQISIALELPREVLLKFFSSSYSAARAALLEAWHFFRCRREWLATVFCQPVYALWLDEAVARGLISAPGYLQNPAIRAAYLGTDWVGDGPGSIDPVKEVEAAERRVKLGTATLAQESILHDGVAWEVKHAQRVKERDLRVKDGLEPPPDAGTPPRGVGPG